VQTEDAVALIKSSVAGRPGTWADLGAGRGTFTRALVEVLGPESRVVAVDRDPSAVAEIESWAKDAAPNVTAVTGDFTGKMPLPATPLDGILLANTLHFVKTQEQGALLARLAELLEDGGRVVLVEYDKRAASRWVPYPIPIARLQELAAAAGLGRFTVSESRPSNYEGIIYVAHADKQTA
jgi:ubiquinone/menaquinone biosynthesis C-methylase UbiE